MADIKTPEERSKNMSAIKRADTKPELFIRRLLHKEGLRYRLQSKQIPGHPDLWLKKYNTAIFINGCFWHRHKGCKYAYYPKSRIDFWTSKFEKNINRDQRIAEKLHEQRIKCLVIWECTIKRMQKKNSDPQEIVTEITAFLNSDDLYKEL